MASRPNKIPGYIDQVELARRFATNTAKEVAAHYHVSLRTTRYWHATLKRDGIQQYQGPPLEPIPPPLSSPPDFPEPLGKTYDDFITISSNRTLILGDSEIPNHDPEIFELAYTLARRFGITDLIINGDFLALDCFSNWMRSAVYKLSLDDEIDQAKQVLLTMNNQFKRIVWSTGNHERRVAYRVDGQLNHSKLFETIDRNALTISEYGYCILQSGPPGSIPWFITHPKNYSRIPLSLARELAAARLMHILSGHTHHQAMGRDRSGRFWLVDGGCCRDVSKTRYKSVEVTTHPAWNSGFTIIINNVPYLINKENASFWQKVRLEAA